MCNLPVDLYLHILMSLSFVSHFALCFSPSEKLTSELQSRENKCMMLYRRLERWAECNALSCKLLLKKWVQLSFCSLNVNSCVWVRFFQFSNEFSLRKLLIGRFCFSLQPWWLAVLLAIFWLFVPPHWSELDASTGRSSVRKKVNCMQTFSWESICHTGNERSSTLHCILPVDDTVIK